MVSRIEQKLLDLSTCLDAQILERDLPMPCYHGVIPGESAGVDYVGDCDSECGVAWVRLVTFYPSTAVGVLNTQPTCNSAWSYEVEIGIMRCYDASEMPTMEQSADLLHVQTEDMLAMIAAVQCCFGTDNDYVVQPYTPSGPSGGYHGGGYTVIVSLD